MTITLPIDMGDRLFSVGRNQDPDFADGDCRVIVLTLELLSTQEARDVLRELLGEGPEVLA
jgi:hypothetical protein